MLVATQCRQSPRRPDAEKLEKGNSDARTPKRILTKGQVKKEKGIGQDLIPFKGLTALEFDHSLSCVQRETDVLGACSFLDLKDRSPQVHSYNFVNIGITYKQRLHPVGKVTDVALYYILIYQVPCKHGRPYILYIQTCGQEQLQLPTLVWGHKPFYVTLMRSQYRCMLLSSEIGFNGDRRILDGLILLGIVFKHAGFTNCPERCFFFKVPRKTIALVK